MRPGSKRSTGDGVLLALAGLLGLAVGWTFGHMHGVHSGCETAPQHVRCGELERTSFDCGSARAAVTAANRALAEAGARLTLLEAAAVVPEERIETLSEETIEHASELEARVNMLEAALHESNAKSNASASAPAHGSLGRTVWGEVKSVDRETLWQSALAGFPYVGGATTSRDALFFSKKGGEEACVELDVVVVSNAPGVCLAVFDSRLPIYTMVRIDRTGGRLLEEERKKMSPNKYMDPGAEAYSAESLKHRALVLAQSDTLPKTYHTREALATVASFSAAVPRLLVELKQFVKARKLAVTSNTVVVMATNFGTLDLVANFVCSCHSAGVADALASVLIFAADASTRAQIELLGVAAWHDEALGVLPTEAAVTYGDYAFVRMMWLKVTSVYLVSALGHNVLFQDADVVWLRNPITYFADVADKQVDTFWMDDGARSSRYTPVYSNSGFYYLRANDRTRYFMHRLLVGYDMILATRSHQHALIMLLIEHAAHHGLSLNVLANDQFPQGQVFHHRKEIMQSIVAGKSHPWVFHMCWTAGRVDKLKYLKNLGLWFLQPTCDLDSWRTNDGANASAANAPKHDVAGCCLPLKPFEMPTPYTKTIQLSSRI